MAIVRRKRWAGLWVLVWLLAGCAGLMERPEPPQVSLAGLRVLDADLFEQRYLLILRIQNPNPRPLEIAGVSLQLDLNGHPLASGVGARDAVVEPYSDARVEVVAVSNLWKLFRQLEQADQANGLHYRLHGRVRLKGLAVALPFEQEGSLPGSTR